MSQVSEISPIFITKHIIYIASKGNAASLMKPGTKRRRTNVQMELDAKQEEEDRQLLKNTKEMKAEMDTLKQQFKAMQEQ